MVICTPSFAEFAFGSCRGLLCPESSILNSFVDGPTAPDGTAAIADRDELERAFRLLPLDQRAVFVLHHHVGLPLVAVAETLGIPDGTARSRLHYATRALRAAFDEAGTRDAQREGRLA